jgi:ubiquinone biosynthesis protein Coq4
MLSPQERSQYERIIADGLPPGRDPVSLAASLKADPMGDRRSDRLLLAGALAHCAFSAPDRIAATYDAAATGWLGTVEAAAIRPLDEPPLPLPDGFADVFLQLVSDAGLGHMDAIEITTRSAALGGHFGAAFNERVGRANLAYPGVAEAAAQGIPPRFALEDLAACDPGTVGNSFYRLITDNGFDLEVLDRDALGLADLPHPIGYLNTRVLQSHDLWHITGGYHTTALHEIGISGFQMGQFGHAYSSMFLAVVTATSALSPLPGGFNFLMDVVLTGWKHGRETPQMLGLDWEREWNQPVDALRSKFGIRAYDSPYPADIIEQTRAAMAA